MKIHLPWIRVTAAAVLVAGVGVNEAAAQHAPYRPLPQQPAAPAAAVPLVAAPPAQPAQQPVYTAYRTPAAAPAQAYVAPQSTAAYGSPTGAQYTQPTAAYPQYPQTAAQYPQTPSQQYPATYSAYPHVAQLQKDAMPAPSKPMGAMAVPPAASTAAPATANNMNASAAQPGACGCNAANYGAGSYYTSPACGCAATGGYPNCGTTNCCGDTGCNENQWFGGIYFLEMGRTNATPVKLTSQMPTATPYPYYPQPADTIMTNRDVNFDFREGLEVRVGSTFTVGDSCPSPSSCGCNTGCGCNSCGSQTTYAWEVAWWGLNNSPDDAMVTFNGTDRIYGMKSYVGLEYNTRPVNDYYDYEMPITTPPAPSANYVRVVNQRVRTDFKAQNLELNFIRFPVCNTGCSTNSCGCGSGGYDACGCNSNYTGCNGGCDDSCGLGFSMYGSCGVRYFHVDDDFMYGSDTETYNGSGWDANPWLNNSIDVENSLVGPQIGWTNDYCWGKWNVFLNSTFGVFNNHSTVWNRVMDENGNVAVFQQDPTTNMNVRSSKNSVAFLGELRTGVAYDFSCHWRGVVGYRAVAITGLATAAEQLQNNYTDRWSVGLIDSDNGVIIHGAQIGAECRY